LKAFSPHWYKISSRDTSIFVSFVKILQRKLYNIRDGENKNFPSFS